MFEIKALKEALLRNDWFAGAWTEFRSRQFYRSYRTHRDHYARIASHRGLIYREDKAVDSIRARIARRGYSPLTRRVGEVHTFAFIPRIGWHPALYPDLQQLGPVSEFDYDAHGYTPGEFWQLNDRAARRRREMNALAFDAIKEAHRRCPIDWVFVYASGLEIRKEFIRAIVENIGVPVVNMCLDDKQSWAGHMLDGQSTGQIAIAPEFDLCWTSARIACEWYMVEGALPFYMPEGCDTSAYRPMEVKQDIPVSFIGGAYGFRRSAIKYLRRHDVAVEAFGPGWGTRSVWGDQQVEILNRSVINLGMGGIMYSEELTNVKTRDFEIPAAGGGMYLTSFNPDLAQHFDVGREIACYRNRDEMLELIRYYLARPEEAREIARQARQRCLREHRWYHRYIQVCQVLGILDGTSANSETGRRTNSR